MARRKELRYLTVGLQDGFSGTGLVDDTSIVASDTTLGVDTLVLHDDATIVPVGARFVTAGIQIIRTVTATQYSMQWLVTVDATSGNFTLTFQGQTTANIAEAAAASAVESALVALSNVASGDLLVTGSAGGPWTIVAAATYANTAGLVLTGTDVDLTGGGDTITVTTVHNGLVTWQVTFTPALVTGSLPANNDVITWLPQQVEMKVGDGNIEWTENDEPIIDTDRGILDGARAGTEQPMEVSAAFVFNFLRASSGGAITVYEALHRIGGASTWHSSSADPCEPYSVDIFMLDRPPCSSEQAEATFFRQFYKQSVNPSVEGGLVEFSGVCVATAPEIFRVDNTDYALGVTT